MGQIGLLSLGVEFTDLPSVLISGGAGRRYPPLHIFFGSIRRSLGS